MTKLGVYEYCGEIQWTFGMPWSNRSTFENISRIVPFFYKKWNARSISVEGGSYWGRMGPPYYLMRKLLWDVDADPEAIYAEYFDAAFGEAAKEMRKLFDMWNAKASAALTDHSIYRWLLQMQEAMTAA